MEETSDLKAMMNDYWDASAASKKSEQDTDEQTHQRKDHRRKNARRACSWVRKRDHKKKMVRRFLSMNPAYDFSKSAGLRPEPAIWLSCSHFNGDTFFDPMLTYSINPYYHIYLSSRGNLRIYHGSISFDHGSFALGRKNRDAKKKTNKLLRKIRSDEDMIHCSSVCKKIGRTPRDYIW